MEKQHITLFYVARDLLDIEYFAEKMKLKPISILNNLRRQKEETLFTRTLLAYIEQKHSEVSHPYEILTWSEWKKKLRDGFFNS